MSLSKEKAISFTLKHERAITIDSVREKKGYEREAEIKSYHNIGKIISYFGYINIIIANCIEA